MTSSRQKPSRRSAKFGVGKEIGGAVYLHRNYEDKFGDLLVAAKDKIPNEFDYQVVKFNYRTNAVSFVQCTDFDTATEPTVGEIVTVSADGGIRRRQQPAAWTVRGSVGRATGRNTLPWPSR